MDVREMPLVKSRWLTMFAVLAVAVAAEGTRHLIKKISVPGDYGWDYLTADSDARRLYVSHDREVVVLDLDTSAVIGKIPGTGSSNRLYELQINNEDPKWATGSIEDVVQRIAPVNPAPNQ